MHLEFVVSGPPISNQQSKPQGRANLSAWRAKVHAQAATGWAAAAPLTESLKAVIINFYLGRRPSVDVDNLSKPILDVMNKLVYDDDRQIRQAEIVHLPIGAPMVIAGASKLLVGAIQAGQQFVYVRIEEPVDPLPLPK
jgi:Holliday junction resolvase RusA-like endonuclease